MILGVPSPVAGRTRRRCSIIPTALTIATALSLGHVPVQAQEAAPATPRSAFITVADDVQLEVVDWGGEGPTLILLAGGGHTAHVFDGFAPRLASRLRVLGITRRGVGASSRPTDGYDSTTLTADLIAVLDSLGLEQVSFAGHSFAGSEMSILAARFPDRVDRLIYLDSAFDYRQMLDRVGVATALGSPEPPLGAYDRGTVADWTLLGERSSGAGFPESEVRQMFRVGPDDIVLGSATAPNVLPAMLVGIEPAPLTEIRAPALALYAAPTSAEVMYPSWYAFNQAARERGEMVYSRVSAEHTVQRVRFQREVANVRQVIITGARHYLFLTHPGEVAHEIFSFMLGN